MSSGSSWLATLARGVASTLARSKRSGGGAKSRRTSGRAVPPAAEPDVSPGQYGRGATVEVDPRQVGPVRMTYQPVTDGDPDPGEIVWTWVPYEENDGRGKDRPVLIVAVRQRSAGAVLAVQLTSKDHSGDRDFVSIGAGSWDGEHRPSWVNIDRVFEVHASGMRREAAALGAQPFQRVEAALRQRYGWR